MKALVPHPQIIKFWEKQSKLVNQLLFAQQRQISSEPNHLERLLIFEKNAAKEDDITLDDEELTNIMKSHKISSPFASDVRQAEAKVEEVMKNG